MKASVWQGKGEKKLVGGGVAITQSVNLSIHVSPE